MYRYLVTSRPVMKKYGRKHTYKMRRCRVSIEKAFLSYALNEVTYDKNAF